jgi:hypothetical protein
MCGCQSHGHGSGDRRKDGGAVGGSTGVEEAGSAKVIEDIFWFFFLLGSFFHFWTSSFWRLGSCRHKDDADITREFVYGESFGMILRLWLVGNVLLWITTILDGTFVCTLVVHFSYFSLRTEGRYLRSDVLFTGTSPPEDSGRRWQSTR